MKLPEFCVVILVMIMFLGFMGIPIGLQGITKSYGVTINESTGQLVKADIESGDSYLKIMAKKVGTTGGILILLSALGVAVGFFAKGYDTSLVILPLVILTAGLFVTTGWTIILHVSKLNQVWATNVVTILFVGIGVAFIWSCVSYFANR